jgi:hypothetical protein
MNTEELRRILRACYTVAMEAHRVSNFDPTTRNAHYLLSNRTILTLAAEKFLHKVCIGRVRDKEHGYYFDVWEADGLPQFSLRTPRPPLFFFWSRRSRYMPHVTEQSDGVPMTVEEAVSILNAYLHGKPPVTVYRWRCFYCASREHWYKDCPRNTPEMRLRRAAIKAMMNSANDGHRSEHMTFEQEVTKLQKKFAANDERKERRALRDQRSAELHAAKMETLKAQRDAARAGIAQPRDAQGHFAEKPKMETPPEAAKPVIASELPDATTRTAAEAEHGYRSRDFDEEAESR